MVSSNVSFLPQIFSHRNPRYSDIPVVSRTYLTAAFLTTAACAMDLVSPFSLYFNFGLIFYKGQVCYASHFTCECVATFEALPHFILLLFLLWSLPSSQSCLQLWRIVTNFLFFGLFSLDFLFHMYFLVIALAFESLRRG